MILEERGGAAKPPWQAPIWVRKLAAKERADQKAKAECG